MDFYGKTVLEVVAHAKTDLHFQQDLMQQHGVMIAELYKLDWDALCSVVSAYVSRIACTSLVKICKECNKIVRPWDSTHHQKGCRLCDSISD